MSYPPPYGPPPGWHGPPPPPYLHQPPPPPLPAHMAPYMTPPSDGGAVTATTPAPYPYYMPGTVMFPVPIAPGIPYSEQYGQPNTYVTNYIYHGDTNASSPPDNTVQVVESSGDWEWVPIISSMATTLTGRAVVGGHEGWDGSPLWVIRSWHNGELIPGKLSVRHNAASIVNDGKEIPVQNIEVLCTKPENLRWVPASNGSVPPGAIPGGRTGTGETLYIGRARYQLSITPGKVHPSHNSCYIAFSGTEVAHKMYDVLCRVS